METVYWIMKNGQEIDIDKMDENHLRNTLKMIVKKNQKPKTPAQIANATNFEVGSIGWISEYQRQTFKMNGDMAQEFNNDVDHYEFESDLGHNFHDDECRNQWN